MIGMFTGNSINIRGPGSGPFQLPSFTIMVVLDYMQGVTEFEAQCEVLRGSEVVQRTPREKSRRDNPRARFHTHAFTFLPFAAPGAGEYTFKAIFDAHGKVSSFSRKLNVAVQTQH